MAPQNVIKLIHRGLLVGHKADRRTGYQVDLESLRQEIERRGIKSKEEALGKPVAFQLVGWLASQSLATSAAAVRTSTPAFRADRPASALSKRDRKYSHAER